MSEWNENLEQLAGHLVWKIGKEEDSEHIVVRVGLASSAPRFAERSRLRAASDAEIQLALHNHDYLVQWVD